MSNPQILRVSGLDFVLDLTDGPSEQGKPSADALARAHEAMAARTIACTADGFWTRV